MSITHDQLDVMDKTLRLDQRAWIGAIEALPGNFTVGSKQMLLVEGALGATFGVYIINSGRSPALRVKSIINRKFMRADEPFHATYEQDKQTPGLATLQPNMKLALETKPLNRGLTKDEIALLTSGKHILYVFGRIEYVDIFEVPHFTNFCLKATPDLVSLTACSSYNDAN